MNPSNLPFSDPEFSHKIEALGYRKHVVYLPRYHLLFQKRVEDYVSGKTLYFLNIELSHDPAYGGSYHKSMTAECVLYNKNQQCIRIGFDPIDNATTVQEFEALVQSIFESQKCIPDPLNQRDLTNACRNYNRRSVDV